MIKHLKTPDIALGSASAEPATTGAGIVFSHPVVNELMDRLGLCVFLDDQGLFALHRKGDASLNPPMNADQFIALCRRTLRRELCRERGVTEDAISLAEVDHLCRAMASYGNVTADLEAFRKGET
jgi:hypothetical protein